MKVLDLACAHGHVFEGWFASEDDYLAQRERGLLECPICGVKDVEKRLTAPRLNLGKGQPPAEPDAAQTTPPSQGPLEAMQAAFLQALQQMVARTEDVGERFADEARRIHYGEAEERGIRGQATSEQAEELLDEGIAVVALPVPPGFKSTLQ